MDRHRGWRHVFVHERRTASDFAHWVRALGDEHYPEATELRLVVDNLNTHTPAALYATFPAAEAARLARKVAFHDTPKHDSWLNLVEIELSVVARRCLNRPLPSMAVVQTEVTAWAAARNAARATIQWCFTADRARITLGRHDPTPGDAVPGDASSPDAVAATDGPATAPPSATMNPA